MLKAVLFDLGGTLVHYETPELDIQALNRRSFRQLYQYLSAKRAGQVLPEPAVFESVINRHLMVTRREARATLRGLSLEDALRTALAEMGLIFDREEWASLRAVYYQAVRSALTVRSGARQTLQTLSQRGIAVGLVTNTFWAADVHDEDLARFELLELLPLRLYSCDVGHRKPHPAIFSQALSALGLKPHQVAYVGDRILTDVDGARRAGLWAVLIEVPWRAEHSDDLEPDARIAELTDLLSLFKR